jgi:hypothetical protein
MIYQINPLMQRETQAVPEINRGLIQVRRIQARLKGCCLQSDPVSNGLSQAGLATGSSSTGGS